MKGLYPTANAGNAIDLRLGVVSVELIPLLPEEIELASTCTRTSWANAKR